MFEPVFPFPAPSFDGFPCLAYGRLVPWRDGVFALTRPGPAGSIGWRAGGLGALLLAVAAFAGCRQGRFAPEAKFVDLYVELKLATVAFAADLDKVNEIRRVILAQHGMTPSQFHEHCVRLMDQPEHWRDFQERVIKRAEEVQASRKGVFDGK